MKISNKLLYMALLPAFLFACTRNTGPDSKDTDVVGLASLIRLNEGANTIYLTDYFLHPEKISKIEFTADCEFEYFPEKKEVVIISRPDLPPLFIMNVFTGKRKYSIPVRNSRKVEIELTFNPGDETYKKVQVAGEMNAWNPRGSEFSFENGIWKLKMKVNPGKYQYQLVVDGKWMLDPSNPDSVDNNMGGYNSLLIAGNPDLSVRPRIYLKQFNQTGIYLGSHNKIEQWLVLWQNQDISEHLNKELFVKIPDEASNLDLSYIRVYAYNSRGVSNDLLIPLKKGKVLNQTIKGPGADFYSMILYNVFVDRFYDGDSTNNRPLNSPEVLPKADFKGGDLAGVIQKIQEGYFENLGVNAIWISPVVKNAKGAWGLWPEPRTKFSAYHGYWPVSFTEIDPHFGDAQTMHKMVQQAHEKNIRVLLDFVANHVHKNHPVYRQHPDWATDLYLPDGSLNTERWDEYRLTTWFDVFLPTLDLTRPEVYEMLSDSAVWWVETYQLDGFRHDATKHIPHIFWRTLTRKLKTRVMVPYQKPLFQIGETYGTRELIGSYVNSGELDAQFDFNVYDASLAVFAAQKPFELLEEALLNSFDYFGWHHLMGNISGNQDRGRFISYAGGDLKFDEDAKKAGWTRNIGVGDSSAYNKLKLLFAFNFTIPGIPVIYYGDEIGMPGGNDPDNRRMMIFDKLSENQRDVKNTVSRLSDLRSNQLALQYGDFSTIFINAQIWVYQRQYFDKKCIVVLNNAPEKKDISFTMDEINDTDALTAHFGHNFKLSQNKIYLSLPAFSFEILTLNE